jgi:hypothetical protein
LDPTTTTRLFAGVDVSKDRLDVCLRWSEPERHNEEEAFVIAYDDSGIDALLSRLLEERTVLVILEATGGFERTVLRRRPVSSRHLLSSLGRQGDGLRVGYCSWSSLRLYCSLSRGSCSSFLWGS